MTFTPCEQKPKTWKWPTAITQIPDLLRAARNGFDLVIVGGARGEPIYKLMRDGELSPPMITLCNSTAWKAHTQRHYFEVAAELPDGALLLKLTARAGSNRRMPRR